jgi:L-ascorbate metabolism protein UlaG (beta-lactamase superfamily)
VQNAGVSVTLVRADHSSAENGFPFGNPNGAIIRIGSSDAVWHCGDTDIFSDMALICELHAPKIALVPIGDRFTMGGRVAAIAVTRFMPGVAHVFPMHYASFGLFAPNADAFVTGLKAWPGTVHVPKPNETVVF